MIIATDSKLYSDHYTAESYSIRREAGHTGWGRAGQAGVHVVRLREWRPSTKSPRSYDHSTAYNVETGWVCGGQSWIE